MDAASKADLNLLQGSWSQTYLEADGVPNPPDDEHTAPDATCTFEGSSFRVVTVQGAVLLGGSFELDATTRPKSITWVDAIGADAGKQLPAIYRLSERTFAFVAADEGQPRPTTFSTTAGLTMREFHRVAEPGAHT